MALECPLIVIFLSFDSDKFALAKPRWSICELSSPGVRDLPILIGVGPVRSGTTWIHQLFQYHPEACVTKKKEVNFFRQNYDRGIEWYFDQFKPAVTSTKILIDMSPSGFGWSGIAEKIKEAIRNPILLIGLRSPYERLLSYHLRFCAESQTFEEMANIYGPINGFGPISARIREYGEKVGKERLIFFQFDELVRSPTQQSAALQSRLGLQFFASPSVEHRVNSAPSDQRSLTRKMAAAGGRVLANVAPSLWYKLRYSEVFGHMVGITSFEPKRRARLPQHEIKDVFHRLSKIFEPDIDELESMLSLDLTAWRLDAQCEYLSAKSLSFERAG